MKKDLTAAILFFVALFISIFSIVLSFPAEKDYLTTADEGTYFNQANTIKEHGWQGFKILADDYKQNQALQVYPPPVRIGYIYLASLAMQISVSYHALSALSVLFFALQCIASFLFIKRHCNIRIASLAGILICFSPLSWGLAMRALSDPCYYLFTSISLYSFIDYIRWQKKRKLIEFICFYTLSILIKESALFLLPFYAIVLLVYKFYFDKPISLLNLFLLVLFPLFACGLLYCLAFGGPGNVLDLFIVANKINVTNPHEYIIRYNSGPWYEYFIDFILLSPVISILFLLFVGYYLMNKEGQNTSMNLLFIFFIYLFTVFSFLPKNARYVEPLDLIYRLGAAIFIVRIIDMISKVISTRKIILTAFVLVLISIDARAFYNYFIDFEIYDPTSFNLLSEERFFFGISKAPLADSYLALSYHYYKKKMFEKCIEEANKCLTFNPKSTAAYINICSAYNEMKDWDRAIDAGRKAIEIDSTNQLAKNNLNWAISQKLTGIK